MAQHDYVIDNSTGANVRADINSALQAIVTNNSGSSAPSSTFPFMLFADSAAGTMKIRNAADNAFIELFQLDGTFTLEDGSASTPALAFRDDLNTGIFSSDADNFDISTGGSVRANVSSAGLAITGAITGTGDLTIDTNTLHVDSSNNRVGIGTTSPSTPLHVSDSQSSGGVGFTLQNSTGSAGTTPYCFIGGVLNPSRNGGEIRFGREGVYAEQATADSFMAFYTAQNDTNTERLRIDSSGNLLLGTTSARGLGKLEIEGTSFENSGLTLVRNSNNTGSTAINICKSRGGISSVTSVANGDVLGGINFRGADGANLRDACDIRGEVDGTPSQGTDMPGRLVFRTSADGSSSPTERMRIDGSGVVRVGGTDSYNSSDKLTLVGTGNTSLTIDATSSTESSVFFADGPSGVEAYRGFLQYKHSVDALAIGTSSNERMRIDSSGRLLIGTTSLVPNSGITLLPEGTIGIGNNAGVSTQSFIEFRRSGTQIGSITQSGTTGVSFNTSSDYRLKENATAISDGITRIKTLKPYRFNFKSDASTIVDGFFAHEVTAVPEAITGTKDEVDSDNNPVYQGIDQSKLVPLLVAAVQELIGKVEALEAA